MHDQRKMRYAHFFIHFDSKGDKGFGEKVTLGILGLVLHENFVFRANFLPPTFTQTHTYHIPLYWSRILEKFLTRFIWEYVDLCFCLYVNGKIFSGSWLKTICSWHQYFITLKIQNSKFISFFSQHFLIVFALSR